MKDTKRQVLPDGLWVVATPIGNLADLTERARMALERADHILCEDTRRGSTLLRALGMDHFSAKLIRMDAHIEAQGLSRWIDALSSGRSLALISDAGTPGISDPGARLVSAVRKAGLRVTPIPGPSAVIALLSVSGFHENSFTFRGFFPRKAEEQKRELDLAQSSRVSRVFVWFESPHRIVETLQQVAGHGAASQVVVGKELTKIHEKFFSGSCDEVWQQVQAEVEKEGEVGEWCFSIMFINDVSESQETATGADWQKALQCLNEAGVKPSLSAKLVSQYFGVAKKAVYEASLLISGKKSEEGG